MGFSSVSLISSSSGYGGLKEEANRTGRDQAGPREETVTRLSLQPGLWCSTGSSTVEYQVSVPQVPEAAQTANGGADGRLQAHGEPCSFSTGIKVQPAADSPFLLIAARQQHPGTGCGGQTVGRVAPVNG